MTRQEEILKAKLDLFNHRAFWWFIKDLQDKKGTESDIINITKSIELIYKSQIKSDKGKFKQGKIFN